MKKLVAALIVVLGLTAVSCSKSGEDLQASQSETQTGRRPPKGGSGTTDGTNNSGIPQVTGLSATASGPTVVSLSWNSVPNATTYWIYRDTYVPAIVAYTNYTDRAVSAGTTYTYAIAAVVGGALGPKSGSVTVTTPR